AVRPGEPVRPGLAGVARRALAARAPGPRLVGAGVSRRRGALGRRLLLVRAAAGAGGPPDQQRPADHLQAFPRRGPVRAARPGDPPRRRGAAARGLVAARTNFSRGGGVRAYYRRDDVSRRALPAPPRGRRAVAPGGPPAWRRPRAP